MSPSERDELLQFLERALRNRVAHKDRVAEALIMERCARHPDALYLLVQRAMSLEAMLASKVDPQADPPHLTPPTATPQSALPAIESDNRWRRGLWAQTAPLGAGLGLGVVAGVVASGLLFDEMGDGLLGDD
jgi:hypothetical protein